MIGVASAAFQIREHDSVIHNSKRPWALVLSAFTPKWAGWSPFAARLAHLPISAAAPEVLNFLDEFAIKLYESSSMLIHQVVYGNGIPESWKEPRCDS